MRLRIFVAVGVAAMSASLLAQAPAERLAFEAASIKVDHSANAVQTFQHAPGGRFTASSVSVRLLMEYAFDVNRSRISGAPSWLSSDRFDIAATAGEDVAVADFQKLVQTLLRDRFRLAYHWQTEQRDIYELVMNKTGKLTASEPGDCDPHDVNDLPCGGMRNTPGHTGGRKLTGDDLAASLSFFLNTRVIDRTGLVGRYDVRLDWAADASDTTASSIFTAVQEQLGLKLEPTKGQVDVLVIDHVEHPTED